MAVTATLVSSGAGAKRWTVTFALDADVSIAIPHGLNGAPDHVTICPLNAAAYIGQVSRGTVNSTTVTINKNAAGGSGGASVEVVAYMPHRSL